MEKSVHNVGELSASVRSAVEGLVGHPRRDDQQLLLVALDAASAPMADRQAAWRDLQSILAEAHEDVCKSGVANHELDRAIDEACDEVRYGM